MPLQVVWPAVFGFVGGLASFNTGGVVSFTSIFALTPKVGRHALTLNFGVSCFGPLAEAHIV